MLRSVTTSGQNVSDTSQLAPKNKAENEYVVREAYLKRPLPSLKSRLLRHLGEFIVNVLVAASLLGALYGSMWILDTRTPFAGWIGLAITAALFVAASWWDWTWRGRKQAQRQQVALQTFAKAPLHGIRFDDGSVSDFTPDGFIQLRGGSLMAFDMRHRLFRHLRGANGTEGIGSGPLLGMEPWMQFSVEDLPRFGLGNRLRTWLGLRPRLETALTVREPGSGLAQFALAPDSYDEARRLAAMANRTLGNPTS